MWQFQPLPLSSADDDFRFQLWLLLLVWQCDSNSKLIFHIFAYTLLLFHQNHRLRQHTYLHCNMSNCYATRNARNIQDLDESNSDITWNEELSSYTNTKTLYTAEENLLAWLRYVVPNKFSSIFLLYYNRKIPTEWHFYFDWDFRFFTIISKINPKWKHFSRNWFTVYSLCIVSSATGTYNRFYSTSILIIFQRKKIYSKIEKDLLMLSRAYKNHSYKQVFAFIQDYRIPNVSQRTYWT